uniref:Uncharacterized protein n=1 Tax=Arundo donax TaxID=35708 RepID=A0A0A8ZJT8_ARUDO
MLPGLRGS